MCVCVCVCVCHLSGIYYYLENIQPVDLPSFFLEAAVLVNSVSCVHCCASSERSDATVYKQKCMVLRDRYRDYIPV